ncbi:MAG: DUF655 domain-containing protein, partial [Candidatus Micrarchaeia archaeon]
MEEYAWIVEYMSQGHATDMRKEPIVQAIGESGFTLLEASVKPDANIVISQRVYVGKDNRSEVERIRKRLTYLELSTGAKEILPNILRRIVETREKFFIEFMNKARPMSIRVHTLDL